MFAARSAIFNPALSLRPFIFQIDMSRSAASITPSQFWIYLNVPTGIPVVIDWGDGTSEQFAGTGAEVLKTHTYISTALFTIKVYCRRWTRVRFDTSTAGTTNNGRRLANVLQWGDAIIGSMASMFSYSNQSLIFSATDTPNLSQCTTIQGIFQSHTLFNQPLASWNVSAVTNMQSAFNGAAQFNQPLNGWNTSSVTTMRSMFSGATNFNSRIDGFNLVNVLSTQNMFTNATNFNQIISSWNVSSVTTMTSMFSNAAAFNQDLSSWITGLTSQPTGFSTGANATWIANRATLFPFLSDGVTRINT